MMTMTIYKEYKYIILLSYSKINLKEDFFKAKDCKSIMIKPYHSNYVGTIGAINHMPANQICSSKKEITTNIGGHKTKSMQIKKNSKTYN